MRSKKNTILFLAGVAAYVLAASFRWDSILDGACSGVWSGYDISCYPPAIFQVVLSIIIVPLLLSRFVVILPYIRGYITSAFLIEISNIIIHSRSFHFEPHFYMPHIFGVWVGTYIICVTAILYYLVIRKMHRVHIE